MGCHSGLSATNEAFATAAFQPDFASAVLKNGGNLIGNTGYGYGDDTVAGYSERLALAFTTQIGRPGTPSIGTALAQAKQRYLTESGVGGFSVYDEKVLSEWTLYGLPFIGVQVAQPQANRASGLLALRAAQTQALIADAAPRATEPATFTRLVTVTLDFATPVDGRLTATGTIADSLRAGTVSVTTDDQVALGRAVLPGLRYDVTVLPGTGPQAAIARGVRVVQATMLADVNGFTPLVTTPITKEGRLRVGGAPALSTVDGWAPEEPVGLQRVVSRAAGATADTATDMLLVTPAQFRATSGQQGDLRRYGQLVLEVTYVDPNVAAGDLVTDDLAPVVNTPGVTQTGGTVTLTVEAYDDQTPGPQLQVSARWTADGTTWQTTALAYVQGRQYAAVLSGGQVPQQVQLVVRDASGNVSGANLSPSVSRPTGSTVFLPFIWR